MTDAGADADITGVAGVIVWTDRFDAMLRFYRDTLGLEPRGVKASFANFAWGGFRLSVAAHDGVRGPARDPLRVMINLAVADVHAAHRQRIGSPAPAGIDPEMRQRRGAGGRFPRTRGDRPTTPPRKMTTPPVPPHPRG